MSSVNNQEPFSEEQKQYLQGFAAGSGLAQAISSTATFASTLGIASSGAKSDCPSRPEDIHIAAQDRFTAAGKQLVPEELAKRKKHGLDVWDDVLLHAREAKFPKGTDVFLFKFMGLFYVAPAQNSFMCRLRFAGGAISSNQMRGLADIAELYAGGFADVTTRANLQLREIQPPHTVELLMGLNELGIINRGAGADNIRNITATPTTGFDPQELCDVSTLARRLHHYIINHRELYGLPRKFNVAFDSGGTVSVLDDTNDIGFSAVRLGSEICFRMQLAGITGHKQFAKDTGILLKADECIPVAVAVIKAFIEHGDRTDRKKARLKYVLDKMGFDAFLLEVEKHLPEKLRRIPIEQCEPRLQAIQGAHVGVHPQKEKGLFYIGVAAPAARLRAEQMRVLANLAGEFGQSELRLTVWQNVLIPHIAEQDIPVVKQRIEDAGLSWSPIGVRAGIVACTGNGGCKFAASETKRHSMEIADYVDGTLMIDQPINVHLTGCPNSCAQHYIGDIGLLGTKVGDQALEGYHLYVGGGYGTRQDIGRELMRDITADQAPAAVEKIIRTYMERRSSANEGFNDFIRRHSTEELKEFLETVPAEVN
ncbi:MAG TPA: NirA family protein [Tepidisphaeraceae bacterium]|nr:NirA family protein [Tepidisphaeraceae bacterium]